MIPDNKEFYINLWAKIKKYGPIIIFYSSIIFALLPFFFWPSDIRENMVVNSVLFTLYNGFVLHLALISFFINKKLLLKILSLLLWGATCYWTFSVLIISVAMYLHGQPEA